MSSTMKAKYSVPISLPEAENLVPSGIFYRCHNSFLVNIGQMEEISRTVCKLQDGIRLPMGRRYYQSFQTAFIHFINQNSR